MIQNVAKILSSTGIVCNEVNNVMSNRLCDFIEQHLLRGKYVSREEFEQLQHSILQLQQQLSKSTDATQNSNNTHYKSRINN